MTMPMRAALPAKALPARVALSRGRADRHRPARGTGFSAPAPAGPASSTLLRSMAVDGVGGVPASFERNGSGAGGASGATRRGQRMCSLTAAPFVDLGVDACEVKNGCDLSAYMQLPVTQYVELDLPLGAYMEAVGGTRFHLVIPNLQFFMIEIEAIVEIDVSLQTDPVAGEKFVRVEMAGARVDGPLCRKIGLNDLYDFSGYAEFRWREDQPGERGAVGGGGRLVGRADLAVDVDPPGILRSIPRRVVTATGNGVLRTTAKVLLKEFIKSLAADYGRWATDVDYQDERARRGEEQVAALN